MKKAALVFVAILLILSIGSTSFAVETIYRNGKTKTVKHFRVFTPWSNDLENGKPLIILLASSEQGKLANLLAVVNKHGMYDELDINLMCVAFSGTFSIGGWETIAEELAEYVKPEYEKRPFEIVIDCIGNSGYGGCCLVPALADRGMTTRELNLGGGADPQWVTSERIRNVVGNGTRVNLYTCSTTGNAVYTGQVADELRGTERFHSVDAGTAKQAEVLWKAISGKGLHAEYTCWDVLPLRSYKAENGKVVRYCLYLPETKKTDGEWPVLIYFHGVSDHMGKMRGLGQLLRTDQIKPKGIVILPQAVKGTKDADFHTKAYQDAVMELAKKIAGEYNGDLNRLSVSGHSDGGSTVYQIVNGHPGIFAACAPISGVGTMGEGIKQTYLWVFQGGQDVWVKPGTGLRAVRKCEAAGCKAWHYVYANAGHEIQTRVFQDTFTDENGNKVKLIDWLMSKELSK
ncbi:MAG: hypothetical protein IKZ98_08895 [Clostridia bacterium]|nr:hypothetical protein [Clostridia bacterium]